jgi:hypothetical protein
MPGQFGSVPRQSHKDRLEGIFRVVRGAQDPTAGAHDRAAMPPHKFGEGTFIALFRKYLQQFCVLRLTTLCDRVVHPVSIAYRMWRRETFKEFDCGRITDGRTKEDRRTVRK